MEDADKERLIQHLTKEVEVATALQQAQRVRNNLTVALGPYFLLGAYLVAAHEPPRVSRLPWWLLATGSLVFVVAYGFLGLMAGRVEQRLWDQCNHWREQVAALTGADPSVLRFETKGLLASYVGIYAALATVFCLLVTLLNHF